MSSAGLPILVVAVLLAGTAAAIVVTPRDLLRTNVVTAPSPFLKNPAATTAPLPSPSVDVPVIQVASMTVEVTPLGDPMALGAVPQTAEPPAALAEKADEDLRRITAAALNLRGAPDKTSDLLATLPRDTVVSVLETSGSWARVAAPDGTVGWLSQNFLATAQ